MVHKLRRYEDDDVLLDGQTMRVPMRMMDAAASPLRRSRSNPTTVTDAAGGTIGLHRPGYRIATGGNEATKAMREANRDWRDAAYDTYERELRDAYKTPRPIDPDVTDDLDDPDSITGAPGNLNFIGQVEGDLCTINGAPGTLQKRNGQLVCVPSKTVAREKLDAQRDHARKMNQLYDARDRELSQEWRKR
jgi:hypothetical protein